MKELDECRVKPGNRVDLSKLDTNAKLGLDKDTVEKQMLDAQQRIASLQHKLWAENKRALLCVFQGMDASGKDGTVRDAFFLTNPDGVKVTSFKVPSSEELDHDFLWRIHKAVPARGEIGVFNRSHYEDVLVVRVENIVPESVWRPRYAQINAFEQLLAANGVTILKFFLHMSKDEQRKQLLERIHEPDKNWKFNADDFEKRKKWDDYMRAYEDALSETSTEHAPWFVIPADRRWVRNYAVAMIIAETLERLDPEYPRLKLSELEMERLLSQ